MTDAPHRFTVQSPLGPLTYQLDQDALVALNWGDGGARPAGGLARSVSDQLSGYFHGALTQFDLPLAGFATPFAKRFATEMCAIPFGQTRTYGEIAAATGISAQAAGQACGANRIPIIVPCHRVMGANGLTGYSGQGGVETKVWLLRHEGAGGFLL